jgi:hypothetical protein
MKVWNDEVNSCTSSCKYSCIRNINGVEELICTHRNEILNIRMLDGELIDDDCLFKKWPTIDYIKELGFKFSSESNTIQFHNSKCSLFFYMNEITINRKGKTIISDFPVDNIEELKFILSKYNLLED